MNRMPRYTLWQKLHNDVGGCVAVSVCDNGGGVVVGTTTSTKTTTIMIIMIMMMTIVMMMKIMMITMMMMIIMMKATTMFMMSMLCSCWVALTTAVVLVSRTAAELRLERVETPLQAKLFTDI